MTGVTELALYAALHGRRLDCYQRTRKINLPNGGVRVRCETGYDVPCPECGQSRFVRDTDINQYLHGGLPSKLCLRCNVVAAKAAAKRKLGPAMIGRIVADKARRQPNALEQAVYSYLDAKRATYTTQYLLAYTDDRSMARELFLDAVVRGERGDVAFEVFGEYWHSRPERRLWDAQRAEVIAAARMQLAIVHERDIQSGAYRAQIDDVLRGLQ